MIDFSCPLCGKQFSLSPKFASRKFLCSGCKQEIVVPGETPPPQETAPVVADADTGLDLLRHAFEDAQRDSQYEQSAPKPKPKEVTPPEPVTPPSYGIWYVVGSLLVVAGVGVAVVLNLPKAEDPARIEAETLRAKSEELRVASRNSETQRDTLWLKSQDTWQQAAATANELFKTQQEQRRAEAMLFEYRTAAANSNDDELAKRLAAAETALAEIVKRQESTLKQLQSEIAAAGDAERKSRESDQRIVDEQNESKALMVRAAEVLYAAGLEPTPPAAFNSAVYESPNLTPTDDATEVEFEEIDFGEPRLLEFCPLIDASFRLNGKKSWRLMATETPQISLVFPKSRDAAWDVTEQKKLSFALRFPIRSELPAGKLMPQTSQIASMTVRIGNVAGAIRYTCSSPRYFEILFFRGHGKFVTIDIPLTGNTLWTRTDEFDATLLPKPEEPFFQRIDWVEVVVVPASPLTSVWIDEVKFSPQPPAPPINLRQEEELQQFERRKWAESIQ
ncbi:MAG: hypothetical protein ACRC46_04730 [Thermoguttaceae bacterium]